VWGNWLPLFNSKALKKLRKQFLALQSFFVIECQFIDWFEFHKYFLLCGQLISHYSRNASAKAGGKLLFIKKVL
jgi:hypothetical protein